MQTIGPKMDTSRLLGCGGEKCGLDWPVEAQLHKLLTFSVLPALPTTNTGPVKDGLHNCIYIRFYRPGSPAGAFGIPAITLVVITH